MGKKCPTFCWIIVALRTESLKLWIKSEFCVSFWKRRRMKRALKNCSIQFTLIPIPMASMCCIWQSWYRYENWNLFLFTQSFWCEIKNWFANLSHLVKSIAWTKSKKGGIGIKRKLRMEYHLRWIKWRWEKKVNKIYDLYSILMAQPEI